MASDKNNSHDTWLSRCHALCWFLTRLGHLTRQCYAAGAVMVAVVQMKIRFKKQSDVSQSLRRGRGVPTQLRMPPKPEHTPGRILGLNNSTRRACSLLEILPP